MKICYNKKRNVPENTDKEGAKCDRLDCFVEVHVKIEYC